MINKYDRIFSGGLFLLIAIIMFWQIPNIKLVKVAMDSRLLPKIIAVLLCLIGISLMVMGLTETKIRQLKYSTVGFPKSSLLRIILCIMVYALFAYLLPIVGFMVSGATYLFLSFLVLSPKKNWQMSLFLVISIIIPVVIYFTFVNGFKVQLPYGIMWR